MMYSIAKKANKVFDYLVQFKYYLFVLLGKGIVNYLRFLEGSIKKLIP